MNFGNTNSLNINRSTFGNQPHFYNALPGFTSNNEYGLTSQHSHFNTVGFSGSSGSIYLAQSRASNEIQVRYPPVVPMRSFYLEGFGNVRRPLYSRQSFDLGDYRNSRYYTASSFASEINGTLFQRATAEAYDISYYNDGTSDSSDVTQGYPTDGMPNSTQQYLYTQVSSNDFTTPSYPATSFPSTQSSASPMCTTDARGAQMYSQAPSSLEFSNASENWTNTFTSGSMNEATINSMRMKIPAPYSLDDIRNDPPVVNSTSLYSSGNSASNPVLEENSFGEHLPNTRNYFQSKASNEGADDTSTTVSHLGDSYESQARTETTLCEGIRAISNLYRESLTDDGRDMITSPVSNLYNSEVNVYRYKQAPQTAKEQQLVDKWQSLESNPSTFQLTEENVNHRFTYTPTNSSKRKKRPICKFCLKNRESRNIYSSHNLKNENGVIECRFLRASVCNICGATGDTAHTRKYCPHNTYEDFIQKMAE